MEETPQKLIVCIDAHRDNLSPISLPLSKTGYDIAYATTGRESLDIIFFRKPALVVINISLPNEDGLDICRHIKSESYPDDPLILLYSAQPASSEQKAIGLEAGADAYIAQPLENREIEAQIQALLRSKEKQTTVEVKKKRLELILNSIQELVMCLNQDMTIAWANQSVANTLNMDLEQIKGKKCYQLWAEKDAPCTECPVIRAVQNKRTEQGVITSSDGKIWEVRTYPVEDSAHHLLNSVQIALDITSMTKSQLALKRNEQLLMEVTSNLPGTLIQFDAQSEGQPRPLFVSSGIQELMDISPKEALQDPNLLWANLHPEDAPQIYDHLFTSLENCEPFEAEFRIMTQGQKIKWLRISTSPYANSSQKLLYAILADITLLKEHKGEFKQNNLCDAVTDLPNHQLFLDRLRQALSLATRYKHKVGLVFLELDDFTSINTKYGSQVGERLLHQTGQRILGCVRSSDTVARYSQDKFAVIADKIHDIDGVKRVAQKISLRMQDPFLLGGHFIPIKINMGLGIYPDDAGNAEDLILLAMQRLYLVKADPDRDYL